MAACQHFLLRRSGTPEQPARKRFIHTNKPKKEDEKTAMLSFLRSNNTVFVRRSTRGLSHRQRDIAILGGIVVLLAAAGSVLAADVPNGGCGCTTIPANQSSGVSAEKLIHCDDIMNGFAAGQERVKIIVNLAEPAEEKAKTDWSSRRSLALLQDKIKALQTPVLSVLGPQEFNLRYRFENQAGFSGEVTSAGLEKLKNDPRVVSIEPVYQLEPHLRQGIPLMKADTYRSTYNGNGTAIAICDTGIDYHHPMLGNDGFPNSKVIGGYDFGDSDSDPMPNSQAHGTCCAGIAAGDLGNTGDYIGGVAYNAKLYALKITAGSSGSADSDVMVAAWNWCVSHKNDDPAHPIVAISTSFGGDRNYSACDTYVPSMTTAANNAVTAGITVLASSGNDGYCDSIAWPSCISSVLSVGAVYDAAFGTYQPCIDAGSCATKYSTTQCTGWYAIDTTAADKVTSYSNTASFLTLLTPSNKCYTTDIVGSGGYNTSGDYYNSFGGTSAACPYAAGAVACLQSAAKAVTGSFLSPSTVKTLLTSTGTNITDGKVAITKPRINLKLAIDNIGPRPPVSYDFNVTAPSNTPITIALQATDDGLPNPPGDLNYIITSLPAHGSLNDPNAGSISTVPYTLAGYGSQVIYTPATDYDGPDNFTFKANDGGTPPNGGDSNTATVSITVNPARSAILFENFESSIGGFTINNTFGAGLGLWHLTTACNSVLSGHSTPTSLYYGQNSACNYDTGLTEGVVTSSVINLAGASAVSLEFKYMLQTEQTPGYDIASVEISVNGGAFTEYLSNFAGTLQDPSGAWVSKTLDLSSMGGANIQIRFRFRTVDAAYNAYPGFYVDDVNVTGIVPVVHYAISGRVTLGGSALDAVTMTGLPGNPVTGGGYYSGLVNSGWSGTVTPAKAGYIFEPNSYNYADVNHDYNDMNYAATLITLKIAGSIKNDCNVPIAGVVVDANNGAGAGTTDANGRYEIAVNYGWSGTVSPSKLHYTFVPNLRSYNNVSADLPDQNYVAVNIYDLDCNGSIGLGDVGVLAQNWLKTASGIAGDLDADNNVDFIDFAIFGIVWGTN
jgi:subtilisin family serine protease